MTPFTRALGVILVSAAMTFVVQAADGANCGDGVGPCSCGDTVVTNTTLDDTDPVTTTICACTGLIVQSGVALDLGGHTISGSNVCDGINIGGEFAGFNAVVGGGRVARFATGVLAFGEARDNRLQDLQVVENSVRGVFLFGPGNVVEDCVVSRNEGTGLELSIGNDPPGGGVVQRCRVEDNQGDGINAGGRGAVIRNNIVRRNAVRGIAVGGSVNTVSLNRVEDNQQGLVVRNSIPEFGTTTVTRNVVLRSLANGLEIAGEAVVADRNQAKSNRGEGFDITGTAHTLKLNIAVGNHADGFTVGATESTFERNTANYNGLPADGYGIRDTTTGSGTAGTANTYSGNRCTGNGLGNSSPPGLCF